MSRFWDGFKAWASAATLAAVVVAFAYFAVVTAQQNVVLAHQNDAALRTEHALCILRADLSARVDASRQFLIDNPDGFAGVPAATIQATIDSQSRTVVALQLLQCGRWNLEGTL